MWFLFSAKTVQLLYCVILSGQIYCLFQDSEEGFIFSVMPTYKYSMCLQAGHTIAYLHILQGVFVCFLKFYFKIIYILIQRNKGQWESKEPTLNQ